MTLGAVAGLLAYLVVAWPSHATFFVLALGALLLAGRPVHRREWIWATVAIVWTVAWLPRAASPHLQAVKAAAVMATGALLAIRAWRPALALLDRALVATGMAVLGVAGWCAVLGVPWQVLHDSALREAWASYRELVTSLSGTGTALLVMQAARDGVPPAAELFPGLAVLLGVLGLVLATRWAGRIADRPAEAPPAGFAALRFSDQFVWVLLAGGGLLLLAPAGPWTVLGRNLLLVLGVLYLLRGAAVMATLLRPLPRIVPVLLTLGAVLLLPFAASGLFMLGLADTWIDVRRRMPPSLAGGSNR